MIISWFVHLPDEFMNIRKDTKFNCPKGTLVNSIQIESDFKKKEFRLGERLLKDII